MPTRLAFFVIVWSYIALATLYALNTPAWQVPDEPAHYNYIRTIAEQGALPVLQSGDYDQAYLEQIKARHFPPDMPVERIRYESHQPPLYYLVASPVYVLGERQSVAVRLIGLRLFTLLLGSVLLALVFSLGRTIFPAEPFVALGATALVAFIPQHLAITSGVDNDVLAEVVLTAFVLSLATMLGRESLTSSRRQWLVTGALMGIGFITKTTTYISVGLLAVTFVLLWRSGRRVIAMPRYAVGALLVALLVALPWFARGALTYGATDWLGFARHNVVVAGQIRTLEKFPDYVSAAQDFFPTLFRSFWGQFGWMGVVLDARLYSAFLVFSAFALLGLAPFYRCVRVGGTQRRQLLLLLACFTLMLLSIIAYSLEFYQPQGRYLFPALGAMALFMAMGLRGWLGAAEALSARVQAWRAAAQWLLLAILVAAFVAIDLFCLYRFIVPQLSAQ